MLSASGLAEMLDLSRGRISQLVGEGKLEGCYQGSGRDRRFDSIAVAKALGKNIDPGQRLGNGASTQKAVSRILTGERPAEPAAPPIARPAEDAQESEYEQARASKAKEEARRLRRLNAEAEGVYVLADEVSRQVRRQIGQEVAEVSTYIRDMARTVADRYQLDFKEVRQVMLDGWRAHRGARAEAAEERAASVSLTQAEIDADI